MLAFLKHLEADRGNHIATRNQRLAAMHCLFEYVASRSPEHLGVCQRVAAIPRKRVAPPETHFLEKDEVETLLRGLPRAGRHALRDRALVLFLYNTGARVSEVAELRVGHLELGAHPMVRLHGKGDKWRTCPLWQQTAGLLGDLLESAFGFPASHDKAAFLANGRPLTRSDQVGLALDVGAASHDAAARHLVVFLGEVEEHAEAQLARGGGERRLEDRRLDRPRLEATQPPDSSEASRTIPVWRSDETLLKWLASL